MINRRTFLTTSAAFGVTLVAFRSRCTQSKCRRHRNHDPSHERHAFADRSLARERPRTQGREVSLAARHSSRESEKRIPNTLLVDAGDVLQGTPYFNFYKGEVEYKAMSAIGYDVGTLGNHEFDNGVEALAAALKFANFDIVSANYDVKGTVLEQRVKRYVVKTVGGIRVGLFGLGISPVGIDHSR